MVPCIWLRSGSLTQAPRPHRHAVVSRCMLGHLATEGALPLCAVKAFLEPFQACLHGCCLCMPHGHAAAAQGLTCACVWRVNVRLVTSLLSTRVSPLLRELSSC